MRSASRDVRRPNTPASPRRRWRPSWSHGARAGRGALHTALTQLAEQDPLISVRQDELRGGALACRCSVRSRRRSSRRPWRTDFGVEVAFRETTTICIERPVGAGAAFELIDVDPNPFLATVGLRVDPAPVGAGVEFRLEVELGSMPYSFFAAVEETVRTTLLQGLDGWEITGLHGDDDALRLLPRGRVTCTAPSTRACPARPVTSATSPRSS